MAGSFVVVSSKRYNNQATTAAPPIQRDRRTERAGPQHALTAASTTSTVLTPNTCATMSGTVQPLSVAR